MASSIQSVLLFGYGNGTVSGSTDLVVTLGFGVPAETATALWFNVLGLSSFAHKASGEEVRPVVIRDTDVAQVFQSDVDQ